MGFNETSPHKFNSKLRLDWAHMFFLNMVGPRTVPPLNKYVPFGVIQVDSFGETTIVMTRSEKVTQDLGNPDVKNCASTVSNSPLEPFKAKQ